MKSSCCHAPALTICGDKVFEQYTQNLADKIGRTFYWQCSQCKQPCDIAREPDYKYCGE